jgi:hypothetical protein
LSNIGDCSINNDVSRSGLMIDRIARRRQSLVRRRARRYSTCMKLAFELPAAQAERLRVEAERLGLSPEELARAALTDLLATPDAEFQAVAARVVAKNRELYRRLA